MTLLFEKSRPGGHLSILPECDVPAEALQEQYARKKPLRLPELSENEISRHYTELAKRTHGVNDGFYPLGSCTMKYNPRINEEISALPGFTGLHPLQPFHTMQGALKVLALTEQYLNEIAGMDAFTFQPAAGAHGEFTGLMLIRAYHESRGDGKRTKILVPDSAHGTNPASAAMAGFEVVNVPSDANGGVDIEKLREAVGEDTAGLMLTNPNTVGLFDPNILEITSLIHGCGGLCYYDGANLNAVMGIARPGDMGFDVVHLNLHKTFSTPHGGGGPGSGPVGCKEFLKQFLPSARPQACGPAEGGVLPFCKEADQVPQGLLALCRETDSIGDMRSFYGNFLVVVRALTYLLTLGREGIPQASGHAVLNANYMKVKLEDIYPMAYPQTCMHEFVMSLEHLKKETGVSALDVAKGLLDNGIHPPTMYFPLIVHEALMVEPTETEPKETMDHCIEVLRDLYRMAKEEPERLHEAPVAAPVRRLDELTAARNPVLRYTFSE